MKIGDVVVVTKAGEQHMRSGGEHGPTSPGIIIDELEMSDGFMEYEVMFESWGIGWFSDMLITEIDKHKPKL